MKYEVQSTNTFELKEDDNYIVTRDGNTLLFNIYNKFKKTKHGKKVFVEVGIKNDYFCAKLSDYIFYEEDPYSETIIKKSEKNGFFYNLYNKRVEKHNAMVQAMLEYEICYSS